MNMTSFRISTAKRMTAQANAQSGGTGAGWSGIHYELMNVLRQYGKVPNGRDEAIRMLKQLLDAYEKTYLGAKDESDEDYLNKFDDL